MGDRSFRGSLSQVRYAARNAPLEKIRSVVVRQLLDAKQPYTGAKFRIGEEEIGYIKLVAHVVSVKEETQSLWLADGSRGRITAVPPRITDDSDSVKEHTYVCIVGYLNCYKEVNFIKSVHVRKVVDPHELYYHLLEAMVTTLSIERGPPPIVEAEDSSAMQVDIHDTPNNEAREVDFEMADAFSTSVNILDDVADVSVSRPSTSKPTRSSSDRNTSVQDVPSPVKLSISIPDVKQKGKGREYEYSERRDVSVPSPAKSHQSISSPLRPLPNSLNVGTSTSTLRSSPDVHHNSTPKTYNTRSPSIKPDPKMPSPSASPRVSPNDRTLPSPSSPVSSRNHKGRSPTRTKRDPYSHLSPLQRDIMLFVAEADRPHSLYPSLGNNEADRFDGIRVQDIASYISTKKLLLGPDEFMKAIQVLIDENCIYTTIPDPFHVRARME